MNTDCLINQQQKPQPSLKCRNIISVLPIYAKMPLPQKEMAKYCKCNSFKEKSCSEDLVQLLTWKPKSQYIPDSDLDWRKVLNSISKKTIWYNWLVLSQHHLAVDCHEVFAVTHSSSFSPLNIPLFSGCILHCNITWGINWNLVNHKNLKPHKIPQSYWYYSYLADFIYSCKQHSLTSHGYLTCKYHLTLSNRDFCCNSSNFS